MWIHWEREGEDKFLHKDLQEETALHLTSVRIPCVIVPSLIDLCFRKTFISISVLFLQDGKEVKMHLKVVV